MTPERSVDRAQRLEARSHSVIDALKLRTRNAANVGKSSDGNSRRAHRHVEASEGCPINHAPDYKPQICGMASPILGARRKYAASAMRYGMDKRQQPIALWMRGVVDRHGLSARAWAERAGLGKDTVSRAMRDDYANVTSTRTIAKLAEVIGERPPGAAAAVPSAASCLEMVRIILALAENGRPGPDTILELSASLRETLLTLADEPDAAADPLMSRTLLRSAIRRNGVPAATH